MVKICDAIMGSGKTSAAISYINSHPEKRFLYITPYLPEAARIKDSCPDAHFVEPSNKISEYSFSKSAHTLALIDEGRNVASTHQAMAYYTTDTIEKLREKNYCVIIDEEVSVLQKASKVYYSDIKVAEEAGYIEEVSPGEFRRTDKECPGEGKLSHMFRMMESRPLACVAESGKKPNIWYWIFHPYMFQALEDVIVLTYLFPGSEMEMFLKINNISYDFIGIRRTDAGGYEFSDRMEYVPEYVSMLKDLIHIEQSEKLNAVGKKRTALSESWYKKSADGVDTVRKQICNFLRNRCGGSYDARMCGTFKSHWGKIRGKGYWNSDVVFSQKSSNAYSDRTVLAYPVNVFPNVDVVNFYLSKGYQMDSNRYALAIMVQWVWRSAIRNGHEIWLYIPSKRMRDLFTNWLEEVSDGGTVDGM